jgi:catechol 2,3-dioxygenase-like lactoylglutathione lyase family enzyme
MPLVPAGHIDQIGIVVPDLNAAMDGYIATLGVSFQVFEVDENTSSFSGSSPTFQVRFAVALVGLSSIELIQPVSGLTIYSAQLQNRGPGIHHIGVYVPDLETAGQGLKQRGYQALMQGQIQDLGRFAYFEAPDMHLIIELLQLSLELPLFLAEHASWYTAVTS